MEFSRASRRRLLDLLNSINRREVPLPLFITLTYPSTWPKSPRTWKKHLEAFRSRFTRRFGKLPAVWRLEYQRRGAPHFHLLVFADLEPADLYFWVSKSWFEVVGSGDPDHLAAGTRVERVRSWRGMNAYAAKYMGKLERLDPGQPSPGRFWGVWYKDELPISFVETSITVEDAYRIRRHMAKYAGIPLKRYADSRNFKAYIPSDVVEKLLRYYGYKPPPPS